MYVRECTLEMNALQHEERTTRHRAHPIIQHLEEEEVRGRLDSPPREGRTLKKRATAATVSSSAQHNKMNGVIFSRYHRVQAVSLAIRWLPLLQTDRDWRAQTHSVWERTIHPQRDIQSLHFAKLHGLVAIIAHWSSKTKGELSTTSTKLKNL